MRMLSRVALSGLIVALAAGLLVATATDEARPIESTPSAPAGAATEEGERLAEAPYDAPAPTPADEAELVVALDTPGRFERACETTCEPVRIEVAPPAMTDDSASLLLEIRLRWNGSSQRSLVPRIDAPEGAEPIVQRGFDSARVLVAQPPEGTYVLHVHIAGQFDGTARLRDLSTLEARGPDLLPNLVVLVPQDVHLGGCEAWEVEQHGARRCLRLTTAIGNAGAGPLELRLVPEGGALAPAQGRTFQRIEQTDGSSMRELPAGVSTFHDAHDHYHYAGLARFSLHPFDTSAGLRSEAVAAQHKAGFCLMDSGTMHGPDVHPDPQGGGYGESGCRDPEGATWTMGINAGWYDLYPHNLTEQYVEVADVPDGVYELVVEVDAADRILELDEADNAASVLLRLERDTVTVLNERGFYTRR